MGALQGGARFESFIKNIRNHVSVNHALQTEINDLFGGSGQVTIGRFAQVFQKHGVGKVDLTSPYETQVKRLRVAQKTSTLCEFMPSESESEEAYSFQWEVSNARVDTETTTANVGHFDLAGKTGHVNEDVVVEKIRKSKTGKRFLEPIARTIKMQKDRKGDTTETQSRILPVNKKSANIPTKRESYLLSSSKSKQRKLPIHLRKAVLRTEKFCNSSEEALIIPKATIFSARLQCPNCDCAFTRNDKYNRHFIKVHSGKNAVLKCKFCNVEWRHRRDLSLH